MGLVQKLGAGLLAISLAMPAIAADNDTSLPAGFTTAEPIANLNIPPARARMSPELALDFYESSSRWQSVFW